MAIGAVDNVSAATVNTSYDQWYLHNLTNTAKVQQAKPAESVKSSEIQSAPTRRREDIVDFSEAARQTAQSVPSAQSGTGNIADRIAEQAKAQNQERISGGKTEEKPDYRAVSLIKNSAIEIPEYDPAEKAAQRVSAENGNAQSAEQLAAEQAQPEQAARSVQPNTEPSVIERANELVNADFEEPVKLAPENNMNELRQGLTERIGERGNDVEAKTEDAEEKQSGSRVPPSQAKAIDAYKQNQLYSDSLNMSNAGVVA